MTHPSEPRRARPSASADASAAAELARIRAMSALDRMALALALGRRCRMVARMVRRPAANPS